MARLRSRVIALVLGLAFFFNLERLDFGQENLVDINSYSYLLAVVMVVAVIALPALRRSSVLVPIGIGIAIFLIVGRLIVPNPRPLIGGIHTYILVTELAFLSILILLAYQVNRSLREFQEAVEQVTLTGENRWLLPIEQASDEIKTELNRSRRYQRPLSVVVVEAEPGAEEIELKRLVKEAQKNLVSHAIVVNVGRVLKTQLRRTDLVMLEHRDEGRFIILCPETDDVGAADLVYRIQELVGENLGFKVRCGTAFFPDDALTFDEVVSYAQSRARQTAS